ncbi:hypothetical protein [Sorangium sp. So ce131]|uniref:hypothetical protein n=1 Tax=Sorangium sp. So ce131 TaxID=3133282 RepID=UPI003F5E42BA
MTRIERERRRPWWGAARLATASLLIGGTGSVFGCLDRPIAPNEPRTTATIVERLTQSSVDKIDLVLAIDNSGSMADKQDILALAIPDLVSGLVNPVCVHAEDPSQPVQEVDSPNDDCPANYKREFEPIKDIHIGIISSSLGGHGASSCPVSANISNNDFGRLLARETETSAVNDLPTYLGLGFLAWDPDQKLAGMPEVPDANDGEADIERDSANDLNDTSLVGQLTAMVKGTGQSGCGFEAQLESVYRFLVDPEPYQEIVVENNLAVRKGRDETVLQQRKDFLRPSSLLAIIMLTDENDCSIREESRNYLVAETRNNFRLWRPRSECAANPNDKCCRSCNQDPPEGCPEDPTCVGPDGKAAKLTAEEDPVNSRCWDQKRRFGFDFLYEIDRYTKAFTEVQLTDHAGHTFQNPIFSDLLPNDQDTNVRDPGLVFFAGIVGVPWQDIARQTAEGVPDLLRGLDKDGNPVGGFKNADELGLKINDGVGSAWDVILGDPANNVPPADPFMRESMAPRSGTNPITGDAIVQPADTGWNNINGREYTIPASSTGDLQYACIFDLIEEHSCEGTNQSCDCREPEMSTDTNDNPLCKPAEGNDQAQPADRTTTQVKAKAYPGLRELQLIRELGPQGIVGSVCPRQLNNANERDYGYRPAIGSIIDRLKLALRGQCLPRTLTPDPQSKQVSCLILEARNSQGQCNCEDKPARIAVPDDSPHKAAKDKVLEDPLAEPAGWDCVCEILQLENEEAEACRNDAGDNVQGPNGPVHGWCYVDPSIRVGNAEIVASCPPTEQRIIRFTNEGEAQQGATLFITCSGE